MEKSVQHPRILSPGFEKVLLEGVLQPVLELVQRDRDLIAEIRDNMLDIYCKGQRLISVWPIKDKTYRFQSHKAFWACESESFDTRDAVKSFCDGTVPYIKQRIAEHSHIGKEIEVEQLLVRMNNLEELNTDYIAVDRQGIAEEGKGRTDVMGVYWPGPRRRTADSLTLALIEVKYGLKGGVEGLDEQVRRYYNDLCATLPEVAWALQKQLRQKARLGLLSGLSEGARAKIQDLPISEKVEDVRIAIALVDYNPRARRLNEEKLRKLPFAHQIDLFHLGFGLWHANSAFHVQRPTAAPANWLDLVRKGQFDKIPDPLPWVDSIEFGHLIRGYDAAREIGIHELGAFANAKSSYAQASGRWEGTATELWLCLFYEHRRSRHSGEPEEYDINGDHGHMNALCGALRERLQAVSKCERNILVGWMTAASNTGPV